MDDGKPFDLNEDPRIVRLVRQAIDSGEGTRVEFKGLQITPSIIAQHVSAFANTEGGILLVGVNDRGHIIGTSEPRFMQAAMEAGKYIIGPVNWKWSLSRVDGKPIGVIEVEKTPGIVATTDGVFFRRDEQIQRLQPEQVARKVEQTPGSHEAITQLSATVGEMSAQLGTMHAELMKANSWRMKLLWLAVGAIFTLGGRWFYDAFHLETLWAW
jgi:hypothetical protein